MAITDDTSITDDSSLARALRELADVITERYVARRQVDFGIEKSMEAARDRSDEADYNRARGDRRLRAAMNVEQAARDEHAELLQSGDATEIRHAETRLAAAIRALVNAHDGRQRSRTDDDERALVRAAYAAGMSTPDVRAVVNYVRARFNELLGLVDDDARNEPLGLVGKKHRRAPITSEQLLAWRREDEEHDDN